MSNEQNAHLSLLTAHQLTTILGRVAQWLEHHSYKVGVDGSIPSTPTENS